MAIIGEKITLDKPLVGNIARNQMESKMELTTKGALYVGTGQANSVTPDGGGDKVPIPITSHIAPNGESDNGKVLVADASQAVGWKIDTGSFKTGTSAYRKTSNAVLALGQPFFETDTGNLFVGKTGTEKLKDLTLDDCYLSYRGLKKTYIYGVDRVGSEDPNALVRTGAAEGLNVTVGASEIISDFDQCYPWSDIEEVTDDFGNVFIKIPKFYSKITRNSDGTYKHQLSGVKHAGFDTLFKIGNNEIDYVMVGKYEGSGTSSRVYSKSGQPLLVNITMDDYRNGCKANGEGYQQYDFLIDLIIKELWLVEMATTNSQSIMRGFTQPNQGKLNTGTTDTVATPTGSPISNTDGLHACKYRGIENLWGNIFKFCDGISFDGTYNGTSVYICTEPSAYQAGKTTEPYELYGNRSFSGMVKTVAPLKEGSLIQYVTEVVDDEDTYAKYYCDATWHGGTVLHCGGYGDGLSDGLWRWTGDDSSSYTNITHGGRLCYKPPV